MNAKQILSISALALAAGAALADQGPLTRDAVRDEVRAARAAGTLMPAGEAAEPGYVTSAAPTVARSQVKAEARQVYAAKQRSIPELEAAADGAAGIAYARQSKAPPTITRAEEREATLAARSHDELIAAGEGGYPAGDPERHATSQPMKGHDLLSALRSKF
jgi:Domain of unknown function (DUF4148)